MPSTIKSSDLEGGNIHTRAEFPDRTELFPFGIALEKERIFLGHFNTGLIQSGRKAGQDISTVYNSTSDIVYHLAVIPPAELPVGSRRKERLR